MLVTLKQIMNLCEAKKCAVGSFNTPNLESVMAVIGAAEELNVPVIIQHAEVHEEIMPIRIIGPIMVELAKRAKVPVCVHLDHGENLEYVCKALDLGFTSVMYDGSVLSFEENMARLEQIVRAMERGDVALEESLKLFQEGTELVRNCGKLLDEAELQVKKIMTDANGDPVEVAFTDEP